MVWHHRRNSLRSFWGQQKGYGKAEALLERKWPEKYNSVGHVKWSGRLYGKGLTRHLGLSARIYHGVWGSAPFQPLHEKQPSVLGVLPTLPEWYLVIAFLGAISLLGMLWPVLNLAWPLFALAAGATLVQSGLSAARAVYPNNRHSVYQRAARFCLTTTLHLTQPFARLYGRSRLGLTLWRLPLRSGWALPLPTQVNLWSETWRINDQVLEHIAQNLREAGVSVSRGGSYDRWDLEIRRGLFGTTRLLMAVEEHGGGRQYFRFRLWPRLRWEGWVGLFSLSLLAAGAFADQAFAAGSILAATAALLGLRILQCSSGSMATIKCVVSAASASLAGTAGKHAKDG
jgi:hypothetical protein